MKLFCSEVGALYAIIASIAGMTFVRESESSEWGRAALMGFVFFVCLARSVELFLKSR